MGALLPSGGVRARPHRVTRIRGGWAALLRAGSGQQLTGSFWGWGVWSGKRNSGLEGRGGWGWRAPLGDSVKYSVCYSEAQPASPPSLLPRIPLFPLLLSPASSPFIWRRFSDEHLPYGKPLPQPAAPRRTRGRPCAPPLGKPEPLPAETPRARSPLKILGASGPPLPGSLPEILKASPSLSLLASYRAPTHLLTLTRALGLHGRFVLGGSIWPPPLEPRSPTTLSPSAVYFQALATDYPAQCRCSMTLRPQLFAIGNLDSVREHQALSPSNLIPPKSRSVTGG